MRKIFKKTLIPWMTAALAVLAAGEWLSGCVPLNQNVQVQAPSAIQTDASGQDVNTLNRCDPHVYPYQVIRAVTSGSTSLSQGPFAVDNQADFDSIWIQVSGVLDNQNVPTSALKPAVDWSSQEVNFVPFHLRSTCEHMEPTGMSTDCLTVYMVLSHWTDTDTQNCQAEDIYPVFIFIYPRSSLHVVSQVNERPPSGS
jgi:hypothetical protein